MSSVFLSGDLFKYPGIHALAHGCNCAGAMGRGIALEFRSRFPRMYAEYKRRCASGHFRLGGVFAWTESGITIFNLGTQTTWRTKAELTAIEAATTTMVQLAEQQGLARLGIPRIGAGLGGLPWALVRAVLRRIGDATNVELVVFEAYSSTTANSGCVHGGPVCGAHGRYGCPRGCGSPGGP